MNRRPLLTDCLSGKRIFRVFIPDVSLEETQKNEPYVLRIVLPARHVFLQVLQIESPLAGFGVLGGAPQLSYAFLCDVESEESSRFYVTSVFSEHEFPWHRSSVDPVICETLGISTHSGIPLLHVMVSVGRRDYDAFESSIKDLGYRLFDAKPYTRSEELINLYKAHVAKTTSPATPDAVGSTERD